MCVVTQRGSVAVHCVKRELCIIKSLLWPAPAPSLSPLFGPFIMVETVQVDFDVSKPTEEFRNYKDSLRQKVVEDHYRAMRKNQTLEFARKMKQKYSFEQPRAYMTIREAFERLTTYVDSSDPDVE
jgi:hypothetical protein